jgi:hypothetical protein
MIYLFDHGGRIFQSNTPLTVGVIKKCEKQLTLMKQFVLVVNNNSFIYYIHTLLDVVLYKIWTICNLLMIFY